VLKDDAQFLALCEGAARGTRKAAGTATRAAKRRNKSAVRTASGIADTRAEQAYWLVSLVACDERSLEDNSYKVYCILSGLADEGDGEGSSNPAGAAQGELITLEIPIDCASPTWRSIRSCFAGAGPLEREIERLFGIKCVPAASTSHRVDGDAIWSFPGEYPLRRDFCNPARDLDASRKDGAPGSEAESQAAPLDEGVMIVPVGPIHAGVIQAGYFPFHVAGEVVERLPIQLGFAHRGIEKLFEKKSLANGWKLAERVAGDNAIAHALAYCQAVESVAEVEVPEPAWHWRGLLLELERLCNHFADCAAVVHDMAFDAISSPLFVVHEDLVRLGEKLTGHRLLRTAIRPGGVQFLDPVNAGGMLDILPGELAGLLDRFLDVIIPAIELPTCRDRLIGTGVLTKTEALLLGATGLPARASGLIWRDFRLRHPQGIYAMFDEGSQRFAVQDIIRQTVVDDAEMRGAGKIVRLGGKRSAEPGAVYQPRTSVDEDPTRRIKIRAKELSGDVFARTRLRLAEAETSVRIIKLTADRLAQMDPAQPSIVAVDEPLHNTHNFNFGLGYVEGWRGEVCYWIMKGPGGSIHRCKVRDPSVFNWPALARAVERKDRHNGEPGAGAFHENILADFPLINKSFNLSYAGNDL
jgi:Ni,Fe-hydrogenase III large subunit/Ni,Fe-hydrogenase III component G